MKEKTETVEEMLTRVEIWSFLEALRSKAHGEGKESRRAGYLLKNIHVVTARILKEVEA